MAELRLTKIQIKEGVWTGELVTEGTDATPEIEVRHLDQVLGGVKLRAKEATKGHFTLSVPIPADVLSDGVQTFVISEKETGARLDSFSIVTGQPMEDDIRAEMDLLREELDMLKRAFRRHCVETM